MKARLWIQILSWALAMRADDGNRTRAVSLGSKRRPALTGPDLLICLSASDPCWPLFALANCTLIARAEPAVCQNMAPTAHHYQKRTGRPGPQEAARP